MIIFERFFLNKLFETHVIAFVTSFFFSESTLFFSSSQRVKMESLAMAHGDDNGGDLVQ